MTITTTTTLYLGQATTGSWIFADVEITPGDPERTVEYTDHTTGPYPQRLSIMFTEIDGARRRPHDPREVADKWWISSGQIPPEDRVINKPLAHTRLIEQAWADWHLNDICAACDHMTKEMLTLPEGIGALDRTRWWLDNVTCPETGYRWGRKWLVKTVPAQVIADIQAITEGGQS